MKHASLDNIYDDIMLLSDTDRNKLYDRMKMEFYNNSEIVAYASNGEPLTIEKYRERVRIGVEQCMRGEVITDDELAKEIETW
ncbi:MAG: hypothetical protein FWC39_12420 [Bacteroidetes bacterium]|nr:hypothetical protein [Bacteroidota bacterium]